MEEPISSPAIQPSTPASPPVKLWSPSAIGWITFFLGFPAGVVLASINWFRMGMRDKAIMHLVGGGLGTFLFIFIIISSSGSSSGLSLLVNLGIIYYLAEQMKADIQLYRATGIPVQDADGLGGCLIGVATLLVFIGVIVMIVFVLAVLGVPLPN
jgi:hypothetical protein